MGWGKTKEFIHTRLIDKSIEGGGSMTPDCFPLRISQDARQILFEKEHIVNMPHEFPWSSNSFPLDAGSGDSSGPGSGCDGDGSCGNGGEGVGCGH